MTTTSSSVAPAHQHTGWGHLARHLLEMVIAMFAGMAVLGMARAAVGLDVSFHDNPEVAYLLMAFDMSVGMAALMRWRGHGWRSTLEMCAAMFVPALLFPLLWAGLMSGMTFMVIAHVAMVPLMLAVMLWRREEYARAHH